MDIQKMSSCACKQSKFILENSEDILRDFTFRKKTLMAVQMPALWMVSLCISFSGDIWWMCLFHNPITSQALLPKPQLPFAQLQESLMFILNIFQDVK